MPFNVTSGSSLQCSMGTLPCAVNATPGPVVATTPACTVMDFKPGVNIPGFGMCLSLGNPAVASATTAAQGVLTPQPCLPATASPWAPGSTASAVNGFPAMLNTSTCACSYGGVIAVATPSQQFAQGT